MDINTQLKLAVKTGEISFGYKQTVEAVKAGRSKMAIISSNCPQSFKSEIQNLSATSNHPIYFYKGSSIDLGLACGKRFAVSTLTVKKTGDSDILRLVET